MKDYDQQVNLIASAWKLHHHANHHKQMKLKTEHMKKK